MLSLLAGATLMASGVLTGTASAAPERSADEGMQAMVEACEEGYLCVWDRADGQGNRHDFYECSGVLDVRQFGLERVGSFINNQTDGTVASFHGPDEQGGPWHHQYDSTAFEFWDNDRGLTTYGVDPC